MLLAVLTREAGWSATAFALFLFKKIADFGCAVTIFTQKHGFLVKKVKKIWSCQKKVVPLHPLLKKSSMVVLAQLVEHRIVVPSVKGSSPLFHPLENQQVTLLIFFFLSHKCPEWAVESNTHVHKRSRLYTCVCVLIERYSLNDVLLVQP